MGVEDFQTDTALPCICLHQGIQFGCGGGAVELRLAPAEEGHVGPLQHEDASHRPSLP
jgi:hypothetical protein